MCVYQLLNDCCMELVMPFDVSLCTWLIYHNQLKGSDKRVVTNSSTLNHIQLNFIYELFRTKSKFFIFLDIHKLLEGLEEKVVVAYLTLLLRTHYHISFISIEIKIIFVVTVSQYYYGHKSRGQFPFSGWKNIGNGSTCWSTLNILSFQIYTLEW